MGVRSSQLFAGDGVDPDCYVFPCTGGLTSTLAVARRHPGCRDIFGSKTARRFRSARTTSGAQARPSYGWAEAGIPREHIAYVLNHRSVTHAQITEVYHRYERDAEKHTALETWARVLGIIMPGRTRRPAYDVLPALPRQQLRGCDPQNTFSMGYLVDPDTNRRTRATG